jgi:hypothetical protein
MTQPATQRPTLTPKASPQPSRMRLDSVVRGKLKKPISVVCYGPEGVGKSTLAAGAPKPIFLGAEDGTSQLDVTRFPSPETYADIREAVRVLQVDQHDYGTLVVDTLDWVEPLLWQHICARDGQPNIEGYGYGKGYQVALDEWRLLLSDLERLMKTRGMNVVLLAHAAIRPFKNPAGEDFDRYELKVHAKAAGLIKEWAEAVLFANWETFAKEDKRTKRFKGVGGVARMLYTERTAAYDAKNRYSLPDELPLDWNEFETAVNAGQVAPTTTLRAEIERKAKELGGELEAKIMETLAKAGDNAANLALINNKVNAKLAEKGQQQ